MRRLLASVLISLAVCAAAEATPCYGTKMPAKKEFFGGFQSYTIFQRYLEAEYGEVRSMQEFFLLSYGLCDWFSIDLKGGTGNIKQHPRLADEVDYRTSFAGGYGFRMKIYERDETKIVWGFQHISVHPYNVFVGDVKHKAVLDDWQVSCLASHTFGKVTPYIGARWSRVDYIHWQAGERKRRMSDLTKDIGAIAGCDLSLNDRFWVNLEGQFVDTEALAVSVNFKF
jgi:hypothetical protein